MNFYLKDNEQIVIKSNVAVNAAIKLIRKIVRNQKSKGAPYIDTKEDFTLVDQNGNEFEYFYRIIENHDMPTNEYYHFDYKINIYKKLSIK